jgi:hypothetical protein
MGVLVEVNTIEVVAKKLFAAVTASSVAGGAAPSEFLSGDVLFHKKCHKGWNRRQNYRLGLTHK